MNARLWPLALALALATGPALASLTGHVAPVPPGHPSSARRGLALGGVVLYRELALQETDPSATITSSDPANCYFDFTDASNNVQYWYAAVGGPYTVTDSDGNYVTFQVVTDQDGNTTPQITAQGTNPPPGGGSTGTATDTDVVNAINAAALASQQYQADTLTASQLAAGHTQTLLDVGRFLCVSLVMMFFVFAGLLARRGK